jgi:hypothetical protein
VSQKQIETLREKNAMFASVDQKNMQVCATVRGRAHTCLALLVVVVTAARELHAAYFALQLINSFFTYEKHDAGAVLFRQVKARPGAVLRCLSIPMTISAAVPLRTRSPT